MGILIKYTGVSQPPILHFVDRPLTTS
jgi:hypothetical protein